ncbi:MAG: hypothetical protein EOS72_28720 [Mesorhizobium sp.]|nr:MAG: hypothetical protein EOS72_28720 [Mesorhizobium sp.]
MFVVGTDLEWCKFPGLIFACRQDDVGRQAIGNILAGNLPIHSRSWLQGPDVARWFHIVGYIERGQENGANLFELPPARLG